MHSTHVNGCILLQKDDGCWWFGQPGRCGLWNIIIATFIVAAATDFTLIIVMVVLGNEKSNKSTRMQRCCSPSKSQNSSFAYQDEEFRRMFCRLAYTMELVCILCEMVIAVCTLVFLFSLQQSLDSGQEGFVQHRRSEMALGFLSLAFTVTVLAVAAIGTDRLTQGARTVWTHVSGNHMTAAQVGTGMEQPHELDM